MANYDFSTLNSSDLEILVCDLLNADLPKNSLVKYRTFKDGRDMGIDILHSSEKNDFEHVGQVKHYYRTGYKGMIRTVNKDEIQKAKKLNPKKYIFATSVDLSIYNVKEIRDLYNPLIKRIDDIYGKADLNRLIEENPDVLQRNLKLWFSDSSILSLVLNSDLDFRSSYFSEYELKRRLRMYVRTEIFDSTRLNLNKNRFIIITGEPGVGKTSLAEMLVLEYIAEDYNLTYIIDDIKEAERVLKPDESKQIIYYDDFLGSNNEEIKKAKGSEAVLISLLKRVQKYPNKLMVLTTRNHLLINCVTESEKLKRYNIVEKASLITLKEYDYKIKESLLYNHIEESDLDQKLLEILKKKELIDFILSHKNFSPRSIEFITKKDNFKEMGVRAFEEFIKSNFNNPAEIWRHAYERQITEDDRILLNTLFSFGEEVEDDILQNAFYSRISFEVKTNNKQKEINSYTRSIKRLEGVFILRKHGLIDFINPSLIDFLFNYIKQDKDEVFRIASSVRYISQLTPKLFSLGSANSNLMQIDLQERLLQDHRSFLTGDCDSYELIELMLVINKYVKKTDKYDVIVKIFNEVTDWSILYDEFEISDYFKEFIMSHHYHANLNEVLMRYLEDIVNNLFRAEYDIHEAVKLLEKIATHFSLNFSDFNTSSINMHLDDLFSEFIEEEIDWLKDVISHDGEQNEVLSKINNLQERLNYIGLDYEISLIEFDIDWAYIAVNNEEKRFMNKKLM